MCDIGSPAYWRCNGELKFTVIIEDAKEAYGKILYLIRPQNGSGKKWVSEDKIDFTRSKDK